MVDRTLEAFGMTVEEMKEANRQAAEQMLPVPYDIPGEVGPTEEKRFGDTAAWAAKDSWEEAKSRFQSRGTEEGVAGAIPDADSSVLNTFAAGLGYAADMGLSGLAASDAAWRYSVGLASELIPGMDKSQEQRFTRDVSSIPEAFAGNVTGVVGGIDRLPDVRQATTGARMAAEDVLDAMPEYDPNTLYSLGGVGSNKPKKTGPVKVPRLFQLGGNNLPSPRFGSRTLRDLFPEDDDFDVEFGEINFEPLDEGIIPSFQEELGAAEVPRLGYTLNVRVHDLANLYLGRRSPEGILNYFGMDPEPRLISYLNEKVEAIKEKPEFQEYLEKYRVLNEPFDPSDTVSGAELPQGVVAQYRSPIPEVLDSLDYPESGIKGSQLLKSLQDSPSVRGSELSSLGVNIDPAKKYTQQEAQDLFRDKLWDVTARLDDPQFSTYQRQPVLDNVVDYFEITINADRQVDPLTGMQMGPTFQANSQHFADSTLAHTRASIVDDGSYQGPYILVEELQSDLLQKGFGKPSEALPEKSPKNVLEESKDVLSSEGFSDEEQLLLQVLGEYEYPRGNPVFYNPDTLLNFVDTVGTERLSGKSDMGSVFGFDGLADFIEGANYFDGITDGVLKLYINSREGRNGLYDLTDQGWGLYDRLQDAKVKLFEDSVTKGFEESRSLPPIKKTEEGVRLSLDALIAKAAQEGVSRIVIPPLDRIVAARFTPGTDAYFKALDPKSGFYATYVKSVDKVLKEYEKEFGRKNFLVEPMDINYRTNPLSEVGETLSRELGFEPDLGWESYLDEYFHKDYSDYVDSGGTADLPSGILKSEMQAIVSELRAKGFRNTDLNEYIGESFKPFSQFASKKLGSDLVTTGTRIDISGLLKDYEVNMPQFSEGGLVSGFNEGGLAMERQMNTMMAEGGIKDSGMNRDPISGNEIPAGSLAKEVRDDVDAKLSEGEYVVPADVVRYFGVNYFEKLRAKAKAGLEEMDRDGRIGGDPVPMDDDFPFSDEELMAVDDGEPVEMAEGGSVSNFNPAAFQPGFSFGMGGGSGQGLPSETKTFVNAQGEIRSILFINGQPIQQIPAGFVEDTPENRAKFQSNVTPPSSSVSPTDSSSGSGRRDRDRDRGVQAPQTTSEGGSGFSVSDEDLALLSEDPFAFGKAALDPGFMDPGGTVLSSKTLGTVGSFIHPALGVFGGLTGTNFEMQNVAKARAAKKLMEDRNLTDTEDYKSLVRDLEIREKNMSSAAKLADSMFDYSGNNLLLELQDPAPTTPAAIPTSGIIRPTNNAGIDTAKAMTPAQVQAGQANAARGKDRNDSWDGGQVASNQDKPDRDRSENQAQAAAQRAADKLGKDLATKGRATGGLVQRPKKKPVAKK